MSVSPLKHCNEQEIQYLRELARASISLLSKIFYKVLMTRAGPASCLGLLVLRKAPGVAAVRGPGIKNVAWVVEGAGHLHITVVRTDSVAVWQGGIMPLAPSLLPGSSVASVS